MPKGKGRRRPTAQGKALGEIESSSAAPEPGESGISSVGEDDIPPEKGLQIDTENGPGDEEDQWLETVKDLARLVLAAYEEDPHRFDERPG